MEQKPFDPDGVGVDNGTYFGLPFEPETAELVLISAPWDVTVSYGAGTAYAPDAVIEASTQLDFYDPLAPGAWRRGIATADVDYSLLESSQRLRVDASRVIDHLEGGGCLEDDYVVRKVRRVNEGCAAMNANIGAQAVRWLDAGKIVGLVGGDHSTPYGLIRALGARHEAFGILHIDAHCDLRDAYEGFEFSHASIMFNVLRDVPQVSRIAQVAVRDFSEAEAAMAASSERIATFDDLSLAAGGVPRRDVGRPVPPHRRDAARRGLRELRHRRTLFRQLPPYGYARLRGALFQPGRLPDRHAGPLGPPHHRIRCGGGVPRGRRPDRRHHRGPHPVETLRAGAQIERKTKQRISKCDCFRCIAGCASDI